MDRDSLVYKAKLAEQAERYDETVQDMKEVIKQSQELTVEERNLLRDAYKSVILSRRVSWRVVTSIEQKGDGDKIEIIKDYKAKIESELVEICNDIIGIIKESLIPNSTSDEAKFFYYRMKEDYHRYLSEFQTGDYVYKAKIESELVETCKDIIGIIEESLIPNSTSQEAKLYYYRMKEDYHRYLSEFQTGDTRNESELVETCNDILGIIEESLIPNSTSEEAKLYYYRMKEDYHRYLSEFQTGDKRKESLDLILREYSGA